MHRFAGLAGFLTLWLVGAAPPPDYVFLDVAGSLHHLARLDEVPEPYRSAYREQARYRLNASINPDDAPQKGDGLYTAAQLAERQSLRRVLLSARTKLLGAVAVLQAADAAMLQARQNPILQHTPQAQESLNETAIARTEALKRVRQAERQLLVELPRRAKEAHLPPAWLQ